MTAVRQSQVHGTNMASAAAKADQIKEEMEEASSRVEQAKVGLGQKIPASLWLQTSDLNPAGNEAKSSKHYTVH